MSMSDESKIQSVCRKLVEREVIACVSYLVSHFAQNPDACCGDVDYDDVLNICQRMPDHSERIEEIEERIEEIETSLDELREVQDTIDETISEESDELSKLDGLSIIQGQKEAYERSLTKLREELASNLAKQTELEAEQKTLESEKDDLESEDDTIEALEHWIVSDWFAGKLAEKGEITGELLDLTIWGRTCSGQAICLDSVIREIASDMGILPGQPNAWEK